MTSHARPCYHILSQYTQNGIKSIIAPTPSETVPEIYKLFDVHSYKETEDKKFKSMANQNEYKNTTKGYYKLGSIPLPENSATYSQNPVILGTSRFY
jgi:hypothetical protein